MPPHFGWNGEIVLPSQSPDIEIFVSYVGGGVQSLADKIGEFLDIDRCSIQIVIEELCAISEEKTVFLRIENFAQLLKDDPKESVSFVWAVEMSCIYYSLDRNLYIILM